MNNKKSKIGCFFGTFNPIHNGHMMMANYVLEHTDICRVIFVISPNSPFKEHIPQNEFWAIRSGGFWEDGWSEYKD